MTLFASKSCQRQSIGIRAEYLITSNLWALPCIFNPFVPLVSMNGCFYSILFQLSWQMASYESGIDDPPSSQLLSVWQKYWSLPMYRGGERKQFNIDIQFELISRYMEVSPQPFWWTKSEEEPGFHSTLTYPPDSESLGVGNKKVHCSKKPERESPCIS